MSTPTTNQPVRLTKTVVDRITPPAHGQAFVRDTDLKGFAVRITAAGARSFIVEKRIKGHPARRQTLGRYGELTVEQARKLAHQFLGQVAMGEDPVAEKRKQQLRAVTLRQAYHAFGTARKNLKASTLRDYDRFINVIIADWADKPITAFTKAMITKRHRELGETRGKAYANLTLRFLRAVLNFAQATYQDDDGHSVLLENPVAILSQTRAWYPTVRRQTVIKSHQLPAWYQAVLSLKHADQPDSTHTAADYLLLLLYTGLRAREGATLRWEQIDLADRTLTIPDPKNHQPLTLPISNFLYELLTTRQRLATTPFVFAGRDNLGPLVEVKRQVAHITRTSGVPFCLHDLRRTFITVADSLDIPAYAIKRLVNHKMNGDVTAGYIVADVERLRAPMQKISDYLLSTMDPAPDNRVIAFAPLKNR